MLILHAKNMYEDWKFNCKYGLAITSLELPQKLNFVIFKLSFLLLLITIKFEIYS